MSSLSASPLRAPAPSANPFSRDRGAAARPDLENIFRFATPPGRAARPSAPDSAPAAEPAKAPDARRMSQPDLDAALDMLNRAAKAMDAMQSRYQQVEDDAKDVALRAENDLEAARSEARDWEARALAGEARLNDLEARALDAEQRAEQAERHVAATREWMEAFYDKVMASFEAHPFAAPAAA